MSGERHIPTKPHDVIWTDAQWQKVLFMRERTGHTCLLLRQVPVKQPFWLSVTYSVY